MHGVGRAGRQQTTDWVLSLQHHPLDGVVKLNQSLRLELILFTGRMRQNHGVLRDRI